ncbi:MAG: Multidrug resistance protein MdtC [Candidatus Anoxychlamydiales bacterium]|nr:Multidrug resistance protein MdtC [Candidatus Anoxychlamydiales bacterium]
MQEVVKLNETVGPLSVNHLNGMPSATISFNLSHLPLSSAVKNLEKISKTTLPTAISAEVQGTANVFKKSFQNLAILLIITVFVIYVILGILYENFIHPLTVMSTLAPAGFGGLLVLLIFNQILSLYSFVGLILLIGIVMKNGIMMVDFANDNLKEHQSAHDAIYNACLVRFRPIMMTSIAAFMGALPIALTIGGASALSRKSLGLVITGGLIISQILTLYLTPVTYILLQTIIDKIKTKLFKKKPELG